MGKKIGLLLLNHGSPASPREADVASYLRRFLSDARVLSLPYLLRQFLVRAIIVPRRAPYSAKNYARIWDWERGAFPLSIFTEEIAQGLDERLRLPVEVAMRYGDPHPEEGFRRLIGRGAEQILLIPLYPQYAMSSYETAVQHALRTARKLRLADCTDALPPFFDDETYIETLAASILPTLRQNRPERLIVSYHGIPVSHLEKTCQHNLGVSHPTDCCADESPTAAVCYQYQCHRTTQLLRQRLGSEIEESQVELVFQSRLGHTPWLRPYLSERIKELPEEGIRNIAVVCPGFVCDCLETLDEIADGERRAFFACGGKEFAYIPCLNAESAWIDTLAAIVRKHLSLE